MYPEDVLGFFSEAFPEEWEKFQKRYPRHSEEALLDAVDRRAGQARHVDVLRHGFKDRGASVRLAQFRPDHALNPDVTRRYGLNRLAGGAGGDVQPAWRAGAVGSGAVPERGSDGDAWS